MLFHRGKVVSTVDTDPKTKKDEDRDSGFLGILADFGRLLHFGEMIVRSLAGFVLGGLLMAVPFMGVETGKPWYFWFGSGILAFMVGTLMCWLVSHVLRD